MDSKKTHATIYWGFALNRHKIIKMPIRSNDHHGLLTKDAKDQC